MGGFLILLGILSGTLLWADLTNQYIWIVLFVTIGFCGVGFIDDYQKVTKKGTAGLSGKVRLLMEFVIAGIAVFWISHYAQETTAAGHRQRHAEDRAAARLSRRASLCRSSRTSCST
jgi:phospho-N-acetylmuramoyl-pentapeptide-transferase